MMTCCRCVLTRPIYRLWRRSPTRIAWPSVFSTPARSAYASFECRGLLSLARGLEGLVFGPGQERHLAGAALPSGAGRPAGAHPTVSRMKPRLDLGLARAGEVILPRPARPALRAGDGLGLPVDGKPAEVKARVGLRLPAGPGRHRSDQVDPVVGAAGHQMAGGGVPGVDQMDAQQEPLRGEVILDDRGDRIILGRGDGRLDLDDQVGRLRVARLGQMGLVADPGHAALDAEARLDIVRGVNPAFGRRQILRAPPADNAAFIRGVVLLQPDLTQHRDGRLRADHGRRRRVAGRPQ